jgi:acetyl esterase/lipase
MSVRFDVSAPYEVEETDMRFARAGGIDLSVRVYRPRGDAAEPLPAIVDVHGGAWARGDRTAGPHHGRGLAAAGVVVVSLDFRQAPDHKHPAAAEDVAAGIRWTRMNAKKLGVDPQRIGLAGSSSGGHLALLVGLKPGDPEWAGTPIVVPDSTLDSRPGDESVRFILALYPVADPHARYHYALGRKNDPSFAEGAARLAASSVAYFTDEATMQAASTTRIVKSGEAKAMPPVFLAHPEADDNVSAEITDAFVSAYEKAGGHIERVRYPGAKHGFVGQESAATTKCIADMREFVGRHLK